MAKKQNKVTEQIDQSQLDTFFKRRMNEIGIQNTADHHFIVPGDFPSPDYKQPIFAETANGDIEINYPCLYGGPEYIPDTERPFTRLRFHPDNQPEAGFKYMQEKKSGIHIFIPPAVIQKFKDKTTIPTLFVVEGEFKAFAGSLQGLDIVGIGGKDLFTDDDKKNLHEDLIAVVQNCSVENLVLLLDADVEHVEWDFEEEPDKDLAKRLYSFYNTVIRWRELAKGRCKDAYFMHLQYDNYPEAKGLDDLLYMKRIEGQGNEAKVIEDLLKLTSSRIYFEGINVSAQTPQKIKSKFRLVPAKGVPQAFYFWYEGLLQNREFNFAGARYQHHKDGGLQLVKHQDSFKFIRVSCNYYKTIQVPNAKGILQRKLIPWKSGEITRDYVNAGHKNFFDTIPKYDDFCNVPCHSAGFQTIINDCYNMYYPLDHQLEAGDWPVIREYLKHVFGEKELSSGHTNCELGLDYLTLLYTRPTQRLPILCLVNKERNTGKSTFLWLAKEIFQNNCTFIGNEELKDHLNDDWASKLIVGVDEGFIDKKTVLERLKSMSTAHSIKLRGMYAGRSEIDFFAKFIITSNDEENFVSIEENETRFWVNKVPVLTKDDPHILDKMIEEIPAFLHYLSTRELLHPDTSRHWFAPELLLTDALKTVKKNSKGWGHAELTVIMQELFIKYEYHTLYYDITEVTDMLNGGSSAVKFRKADVKKQLNEKFHLYARNGRYQQPLKPSEQNAVGKFEQKHGRMYEFRVEDFYSTDELNDELKDIFDVKAIEYYRSTTKAIAAVSASEDNQDDLPF